MNIQGSHKGWINGIITFRTTPFHQLTVRFFQNMVIQCDSFGTRPKKMRISQRLFIRFWTCIFDYIPCFRRSMSILLCRSLTGWVRAGVHAPGFYWWEKRYRCRHRHRFYRCMYARPKTNQFPVVKGTWDIFFHGTLNTARYLEIFNEFVDQLDDEELRNGYFQQDGATCNTSNESMTAWPKSKAFLMTGLFGKPYGRQVLLT